MTWTVDGPFISTRLADVEARVEVINAQPLWDSFVDVHIYTDDGRHLTGEFIPVRELVAWFAAHHEPYWTSNLVVIAEPSLDAVAEAVRHLLVSGEATAALLDTLSAD